jgi:hypothetical protein
MQAPALFWESLGLYGNLIQAREIVGNHLTMGRIAKWALKLMGLDITYFPQTVIKSQALADFMAEWTEMQ